MLPLRQGRRRLFPLLLGRQAGCSTNSSSIGCNDGSYHPVLRIPDPVPCEATATRFAGAIVRNFRTRCDELGHFTPRIRSSTHFSFTSISRGFALSAACVNKGSGEFNQVLLQQKCGISTTILSPGAVADGDSDEPVRSPLSQAPGPLGSGKARPGISEDRTTQAVLTGIRQSPQKLNLVAEMVRGMRVEDALTQMSVSVKRAAKIVYKVVHSAQANAVHNFGMDKDRLIVREVFVGKDRYLKRMMPHGKGKAGKMEHARARLTVVVKEMSLEQETDLARLRLLKRQGTKMSRSQGRLVPHRLLETQWNRQGNRQGKPAVNSA